MGASLFLSAGERLWVRGGRGFTSHGLSSRRFSSHGLSVNSAINHGASNHGASNQRAISPRVGLDLRCGRDGRLGAFPVVKVVWPVDRAVAYPTGPHRPGGMLG